MTVNNPSDRTFQAVVVAYQADPDTMIDPAATAAAVKTLFGQFIDDEGWALEFLPYLEAGGSASFLVYASDLGFWMLGAYREGSFVNAVHMEPPDAIKQGEF